MRKKVITKVFVLFCVVLLAFCGAVACTNNTEAQTYTITWKNGDAVLKTEQVKEGETPAYTGETPLKAPTAEFMYTFAGWNEELVAVSGDAVYTAKFTEAKRTYTITWKNGVEILGTNSLNYGETPAYAGDTPVKAPTAEFKYTFAGWNEEIVAVSGDAVYTAKFTEAKQVYTVKFNMDGGTEIADQQVEYGKKINAVTPEKADYTFIKWVDAQGNQVDLSATTITGDVTFKAVWAQNADYTIRRLKRNINGSFTVAETVQKTGYIGQAIIADEVVYTGFVLDTLRLEGKTITQDDYAVDFVYEIEGVSFKAPIYTKDPAMTSYEDIGTVTDADGTVWENVHEGTQSEGSATATLTMSTFTDNVGKYFVFSVKQNYNYTGGPLQFHMDGYYNEGETGFNDFVKWYDKDGSPTDYDKKNTEWITGVIKFSSASLTLNFFNWRLGDVQFSEYAFLTEAQLESHFAPAQ